MIVIALLQVLGNKTSNALCAASNGLGHAGVPLAFGSDTYAQLGNGSSSGVVASASGGQVKGFCNAAQMSAGAVHSVALKTDGTVWAWGDNSWGELGNAGAGSGLVNTPVQVQGLPSGVSIVQVAAGYYTSAALTSTGNVWTWGYNGYGQLGNPGYAGGSPNVPVEVVAGACGSCGISLSGIKAISLNWASVLALSNGGTVWSWGWNQDFAPGGPAGQLGDGASTDSGSPMQVCAPGAAVIPCSTGSGDALTNVAAISVGTTNSEALLTNGSVLNWGKGNAGGLGQGGASAYSSIPVSPILSGTFTAISAGNGDLFALRSDGTLWSWGWNEDGTIAPGYVAGLLGRASCAGTAWCATPEQVSGGGIPAVTAVTAGNTTTYALDATGQLWSWGSNQYGGLGLGNTDTVEHETPGKVTGLTAVLFFSAGFQHVLIGSQIVPR